MPPSGRKNFKRKLVDRYKRSLFSNKLGSQQIKSEVMKLIKNSNELIDIEMIGLKNFQYCFNSSDCNSLTSNNNQKQQQQQQQQQSSNVNLNNQIANYSTDLDFILNQNGITYEQMQSIIEELIIEHNYRTENQINLR